MTDSDTRLSAGSEQSLLPCPFCGKPPLLTKLSADAFAAHCGNQECGVGCETSARTPEDVVSAWNTRYVAPAQAVPDPTAVALADRIELAKVALITEGRDADGEYETTHAYPVVTHDR